MIFITTRRMATFYTSPWSSGPLSPLTTTTHTYRHTHLYARHWLCPLPHHHTAEALPITSLALPPLRASSNSAQPLSLESGMASFSIWVVCVGGAIGCGHSPVTASEHRQQQASVTFGTASKAGFDASRATLPLCALGVVISSDQKAIPSSPPSELIKLSKPQV